MGVGIVLMFGIVLFILPGIAVYFVGGELDTTGYESGQSLIKDHRLWVISAVFWVASGIAFFMWKTRIPKEEPVPLERDEKGRFVSRARSSRLERGR